MERKPFTYADIPTYVTSTGYCIDVPLDFLEENLRRYVEGYRCK